MPKTTRSRNAKTTKRSPAKRSTTSRGRISGSTTSRRNTPKARRSPKVTITLRQKSATGEIGGIPMRSVTPQLVVDGANEAMAWYGKVFGAKELDRKPSPDGRIMHAVLQIGDTAFMISDSFGQGPPEMSGAYLHIQDKGLDGMWQKAVGAGAKEVLPLANQFWGDRYGQLRDPWGQLWSLGWPAKMTEAEKRNLQEQSMAQFAQQQAGNPHS